MPQSSASTEPKTLDVENQGRRLSEEGLLNQSIDYDDSPNHDDKDYSEQTAGFFGYLTNSASSTQRGFGVMARLRRIIAKVVLFLLPSFISSYFSDAEAAPEKLAPTAWLDGLRGLACFCVVIHHYFGEHSKGLEDPYDGAEHVRFVQLPIVKLVHHGPPMVKIFFIISGFVLTVKAVRLTRVAGAVDSGALVSNLSTSIWKRYIRLFTPCAAGFVLCAFMISAGMMEVIPSGTHPKWIAGPLERRPPTKDNIFQQLAFAFWDFYVFGVDITLFGIKGGKYATDGHLWTIPVEFKCSISLFIFVAGSCMLKRWLRVYVLLPISYLVLLWYGAWGLSLFLFGYFLAELNGDLLAANNSKLPTNNATEKPSAGKSLLKIGIQTILVFIGLFLISYPRKNLTSEYTTGFSYLASITPKKYPLPSGKRADLSHEFWQSIGAMVLIWTLMYLPRVQRVVLCNKVVQYFGKISFALYIMHGHMQHSFGYWAVVNGLKFVGIWRYDVTSKSWNMVPGHDNLHSAVIFFAWIFVTLPMTICWADVFWRAADLQSVRLLRWLEPKIKR